MAQRNDLPYKPPSLLRRGRTAIEIIVGLRSHDFRAAGTFVQQNYPRNNMLIQALRFSYWILHEMFRTIPEAMVNLEFSEPVSTESYWLAAENPLESYPWSTRPDTLLPNKVDVVVIGAGFTGAACAYHWSKDGRGTMAVLEMSEVASGASGRNEGLVVMGRFFSYVKETVVKDLERTRRDLTPIQREAMATKFANAYVRAAYKNADMIEHVIRKEGYDCDYHREGWVQGKDAESQGFLEESVQASKESGFDDWTKIPPKKVLEITGMKGDHSAGFSKRAASWHPARWVWSLLSTALNSENIDLFTHTRVVKVEDKGETYIIHTERGSIECTYVINAIESYTSLLHPQFEDKLFPVQTQAAFAEGGPDSMKAQIGMGSKNGWFRKRSGGVIFGSDATRVASELAGTIRPSRFITKFIVSEIHRHFKRSRMLITREWSCTAGFTHDEYPIVGLMDGKKQYIISGMCGSGSAVHFNGAHHVVEKILGLQGPGDYPDEFFSPVRVLDPGAHRWPVL